MLFSYSPFPPSYLVPLAVNALRGDAGVGIVSSQFDAIVLSDFLNFSVDGLDSFPLFIRLWKSGLELLVSRYQSLQKEKSGRVISFILKERAPHRYQR